MKYLKKIFAVKSSCFINFMVGFRKTFNIECFYYLTHMDIVRKHDNLSVL
jgi:hypothetical protein